MTSLWPTDDEIAHRRVFRLAVGVFLSLLFSQIMSWPMSYIAPIFTLIILGLPMPAPSLKGGIVFVLALMLPVMLSTVLIVPLFEHARGASVLLVILALYASFYYSARGGSPVLGVFMTVGLTIVIAVGSVSTIALMAVIKGLWLGAIFGVIFVWVAHALLPELPKETSQKPKKTPPTIPLSSARRSAFRAMMIVLPIALFFLFSASSAAYVAVMIKVASMGQQADTDTSRSMGREQIESTLWGGLAAIIAWQLMHIWPSLLMYSLLIILAGLFFGKRIFSGKGMHKKAAMWSYAFLTMIIVLAPSLLDNPTSGDAGSAFYSRLILFVFIAFYGAISVIVFDTFWRPNKVVVKQA